MASSYEIQQAIAAKIATACPFAKVLCRDINSTIGSGWWEIGQSASDNNRVHLYVVTQESDILMTAPYAEYNATYGIWGILEYQSGTDSSNTEKTFSDERDAIKLAFAPDALASDATLSLALPPSFDLIELSHELANKKLAHIEHATLTIQGLKIGC